LSKTLGVENAGNILYVSTNSIDNDGKPNFLKITQLQPIDLDKLNEYTEKSCQENIMIASRVRFELIKHSENAFDTQKMQEIFNLMNNLTYYDRLIIEEQMKYLFSMLWVGTAYNYEIKPLMYKNYGELNNNN
jgi:hypothetical protein